METTYDVRIYKTEVYRGAKATTYWVRWRVADRRFKEPFRQKALAESFRADLTSAARKGEAFVVESGRPVSLHRELRNMTCYELACSYADLKWPRSAAMTRKTAAEALTAVIPQLFKSTKGKPADRLIRTALRRWAFNTPARQHEEAIPSEIRAALSWVARNSLPASALLDAEVLRRTLDGLTLRLDGQPMSPDVVSRRRKIFTAMLEHGVEAKALGHNPWPKLKWTAPRSSNSGVDRRRVVNPMQARTLFAAVGRQGRIGPRMVTYYECLYYAMLRPEEAASIELPRNLVLPDGDDEWGEFVLEAAEPHAGKAWTDSGRNRDRRQLKQRAIGEVRRVPCPPVLTASIRRHIERFKLGPGGRLFVGERNKTELPILTINRVWRQARAAAFTPEVYASPLGETPYDLRHAGISTQLNAGISPTQIAEWAGQSPEVLWRNYAKCLDGGVAELRRRMEAGYGVTRQAGGGSNVGTYSAQILVEGR
ncbi:tyrosine-type recombinase/integrase [Paractinoplanes atraurantiacus]|uniref:tyrosine-type recombinase/integrase n=1 Tax=Paractinoplanes atraurantiacus TaxID=1036182 RepID=UPI0015CF25FB|nr:integrase [Actinoplanes atraurantiacus]